MRRPPFLHSGAVLSDAEFEQLLEAAASNPEPEPGSYAHWETIHPRWRDLGRLWSMIEVLVPVAILTAALVGYIIPAWFNHANGLMR